MESPSTEKTEEKTAPTPAPQVKVEEPAPISDIEPTRYFNLTRYRVEDGGNLLTKKEVAEAVYPFLGPYQTEEAIEQARLALEKRYHEKGYQTISVQLPPQRVKNGVIIFKVASLSVGNVRVKGSRYYSLKKIKEEAPSLSAGKIPNITEVTQDVIRLNQLPDRHVIPALSPGREPGTIDVDLNVQDSFPLHGSVEINNRYSSDTKELRVNGYVNYANLWQLGHTIGGSFQVAPQDIGEVKVFSGFYSAPIPGVEGLTLQLQGTKQESNVTTLGTFNSLGRGETIGPRAIFNLPPKKDFYHNISIGIDYKHNKQDVATAGGGEELGGGPDLIYYPINALYSATWLGKGYSTVFSGGLTLGVRGLGSRTATFEANRHGSDGDYIYFRGNLSHTQDFAEGIQLFGRLQGQATGQALVSPEQISGGGLDTVRGYLESEVSGDNAAMASVELRTPSLGTWLGKTVTDWRFYIFAEGGVFTIQDPLPEQENHFELASYGVGTRLKVNEHYNGSFDLGFPVTDSVNTEGGKPHFVFRLWAEF